MVDMAHSGDTQSDHFETGTPTDGVSIPIYSSRRLVRKPSQVTEEELPVEDEVADAVEVTLPDNEAVPEAGTRSASGPVHNPSEAPIERLARVLDDSAERITSLKTDLEAAADGDTRAVALVLEGLLEYQCYQRAYTTAQRLYRRAHLRTITTTVLQREADRLEGSFAAAEPVLISLLDNPEQLQHLLAKVVSTTSEERAILDETVSAAELAERCAVLRALVTRAKQRLAKLSDLSVRQRSLREQLQQFTPLDELPYVPRSATEREACQSALEKLEPLYARLETDIASLPEPHIAPRQIEYAAEESAEYESATRVEQSDQNIVSEAYAAEAEVDEEMDHWGDVPYESAAATEAAVTLPTAYQDNESDWALDVSEYDESPRAAEDMAAERSVSDWSALATPAESSEAAAESDEFELGWYELQHGDSLSDILYGESAAGWLPCMDEIDQSYTKPLIRAVREYLSEYEYVRSYVGFPVGDPQWWLERGGQTAISLDRLNDVVMYVGVQYRFITVSRAGRAQLRSQFAPLEEQKTYVPPTAQFSPQQVKQANAARPLEQLFAGVATWLAPRQEGGSPEVAQKSTVRAAARTTSPTQSDSAPASGPTTRDRRPSAEEQVIETVYGGNAISYQRDRTMWIARTLLPPADRASWSDRIFGDTQKTDEVAIMLEPLTSMTVAQWQHFTQYPAERYEWLIQHGIRPSGWQHIANVITRWYQIAKQSVSVHESTTVEQLAGEVFMEQVRNGLRTE